MRQVEHGSTGYDPPVSTPVAIKVARFSRRALCAAITLTLSLTCIALMVAAPTTHMTGASTAAPAIAVAHIGGLTEAAGGVVVREPALLFASVASPDMGSMCDSACITELSKACMVAVALTVLSLLALLLASRRDTFVQVLARHRPSAQARRRRRQTPWTVPSPISLCVLRV